MKRILSLILCLSLIASALVCGVVVSAEGEEPAWTEVTTTEITDYMGIDQMKGFEWMGYADGSNFTNLTVTKDPTALQPFTYRVPAAYNGSWAGAVTLSSEELTGAIAGKEANKLNLQYVQIENPAANTIMFYVEIPDYEKSGADYALGLSQLNLTQNGTTFFSNIDVNIPFSYLSLDGSAWVDDFIIGRYGTTDEFAKMPLPSGFKGYVKIDLNKFSFWPADTFTFTQSYKVENLVLTLNSIGGECGDMTFGGILYFPSSVSTSTYAGLGNNFYKLNKYEGSNILAKSYYSYNSANASIRTNPEGNTVTAQIEGVPSAAVWELEATKVTSLDGNLSTTNGYYNMFARMWPNIQMQPGVDTFMMYVEVPEHTASTCALKLDYPMVQQNGVQNWINPAQAVYEYMDVNDGVWKKAQAGGNGELNDIPSGFEGYLKFDIKNFNGYLHNAAGITIDMSKPYNIECLQLSVNHIGGEDNPLILGALYSVFADNDSYMFTNSVVGTVSCAKAINGDLDANGIIDANDLIDARRILLGISNLNLLKEKRSNIHSADNVFNVKDLVALKKLIAAQ
ncbi:MAG: hypothetical protein E7562_03315 [Ruminococcaceae bacterium]|nr:hypothetical protein [Oscillospiraceae bacterium]